MNEDLERKIEWLLKEASDQHVQVSVLVVDPSQRDENGVSMAHCANNRQIHSFVQGAIGSYNKDGVQMAEVDQSKPLERREFRSNLSPFED